MTTGVEDTNVEYANVNNNIVINITLSMFVRASLPFQNAESIHTKRYKLFTTFNPFIASLRIVD